VTSYAFPFSCPSENDSAVFHAFVKKTQRTPPLEMELARKRLKELLDA
jgi:phage-related protein